MMWRRRSLLGLHVERKEPNESVLDVLDSEVRNEILSERLYIGVSRRTKCIVGKDKARIPFTLHEVYGMDEEYNLIKGRGIEIKDVDLCVAIKTNYSFENRDCR